MHPLIAVRQPVHYISAQASAYIPDLLEYGRLLDIVDKPNSRSVGSADSCQDRFSHTGHHLYCAWAERLPDVLCMSYHISRGFDTDFGPKFLRPRWTGLYAARKRQKNDAAKLPELPDTTFGWIPVLYSITEEEVLASAGLDAFVVCNHMIPYEPPTAPRLTL